ncbi:MAG: hypothetical protein H6708_04745 [Kofleriaceae bacterium]|nr:hypothetical protein [Kofleriaceae bacterium]
MSDDGGHEPHEPHEDDGGFFSAAGILHAVTDVGIGAAHHALGAGARALGIPMGPLGVALGAHELYEGYEKGDVTTGLQGALGMVGGAAGTIEARAR